MDFSDQLKNLSERVAKLKDQIHTEEATKNAFIMPFIQLLGYDVFNPTEVIPEYVADIGLKKGEKVDYCIVKDNKPILIIECKHWSEDLNVHNSQLFRYFHTTKAKFGLLTNGINYKFYTDLDETNKMDDKPFLDFNILEMKENLVSEVKKFHKQIFNESEIFSSANDLKFAKEVRDLLQAELNTPSEEFVKLFARKVYKGLLMPKIVEQFKNIVRKSANQLINDMISERLKAALKNENEREHKEAIEEAVEDVATNKIVTTEEEIEAYYIVKSILREQIKPERVFHRDNQSYLSIILDDSIRKQICRVWLNGTRKYVSIFDEGNKEIKVQINNIQEIYLQSEALIKTALKYSDKVAE
jgi:hypothetical protein